jgi:hypothetical protein
MSKSETGASPKHYRGYQPSGDRPASDFTPPSATSSVQSPSGRMTMESRPAMKLFEAIRIARKCLFETGAMRLEKQRNGKGIMVSTDPKRPELAEAYNRLAEEHAKMV